MLYMAFPADLIHSMAAKDSNSSSTELIALSHHGQVVDFKPLIHGSMIQWPHGCHPSTSLRSLSLKMFDWENSLANPLDPFKILHVSMEKHREFSPRSQFFGPRFWPLSFSSGFLPGARTGATPSSTVPSHIHGDSKMLKGIPRKNIKKTSRYIKQHLACQTGIDTYLMSLQKCRVAHLEANPPRWGMVWVTTSASPSHQNDQTKGHNCSTCDMALSENTGLLPPQIQLGNTG